MKALRILKSLKVEDLEFEPKTAFEKFKNLAPSDPLRTKR